MPAVAPKANTAQRLLAMGTATILALGMLGACSDESPGKADAPSAQPTIAQRYRDDIDDILKGEPSDLEAAVFADYYVTAAEMQQVEDAFRACVADKGYDASFTLRGDGYSYGISQEEREKLALGYQDDLDAGVAFEKSIVDPCASGTITMVASVYAGITSNPDALSMAELLRLCLAKVDRADEAAKASDEEISDLVTNGAFGTEAQTRCATGFYE